MSPDKMSRTKCRGQNVMGTKCHWTKCRGQNVMVKLSWSKCRGYNVVDKTSWTKCCPTTLQCIIIFVNNISKLLTTQVLQDGLHSNYD